MSSRIADRRGRPARQVPPHPRRGAAMIIVIAIMTILLAIALTFFTVTKLEVQTATNVRNIVDVDLLADAAIAITQAHLNEDLFRHPEYTSLDHGLFTLFNGAAWAGKPWAVAASSPSFRNKGTVEIDFTNLPALIFDDGHEETLYRGRYSQDWLAIPRLEANGPIVYLGPEGQSVERVIDQISGADRVFTRFDAINEQGLHPFVTASYYGQPLSNASGVPFTPPPKESGLAGDGGAQYAFEQIHEWADIDNDGDGFRDSVWLPIPRDRFFPNSNADENLNGIIDETQDNDLNDDIANEALLVLTRTDNAPTEEELKVARDAGLSTDFFINDSDEAIESGVFVYYGGQDGLDNDRDGFLDQADSPGSGAPAPYEYSPADFTVGYFLTAPLPGIQISVDIDADGVVPDMVPVINAGRVEVGELRIRLPNQVRVLIRNPANAADVRALLLTAENVDRLDNDFDLTVNDYYTYAYVGPNLRPDLPPFALSGFTTGGVPKIIFDGAVFNSYIQSTATRPPELPPNYYGTWRQPGNWYVSAANDSDASLFDVARIRGYTDINTDSTFDIDGDGLPNLAVFVHTANGDIPNPGYNDGTNSIDYTELVEYIRITHSGEPVCELVGRMAVLVTDEVSKPNLNTIGGHTFTDEFADSDGDGLPNGPSNIGSRNGILERALNQGATTAEYESRVLPDIGYILASNLNGQRNGVPTGDVPLPVDVTDQTDFLGTGGEPGARTLRMGNGEYYSDVSFPGYGRTDDNGNAFLLSLNGIDDDGDGLIDEGIYLPELSNRASRVLDGTDDISLYLGSDTDPTTPRGNIAAELNEWTRYFRRLGHFEGIDEPAEFQDFAPYRNLLAERDLAPGPLDNDNDNVANEIGELADRPITNKNQLRNVDQIGDIIADRLASIATLHGSSKNVAFLTTQAGLRGLNKLDYNFATAQQLAASFLLADPEIRPVTDIAFVSTDPADPLNTIVNYVRSPAVRAFTEGLRQGDVHLSAATNGGFLFNASGDPSTVAPFHRLPADPVLQAMQAAVNIVDSRDRDHLRTYLTTESRNLVTDDGDTAIPFPSGTVNETERISDKRLFPIEPIENQLNDIYGETTGRRLESIDEWWSDPNELDPSLRRVVNTDPLDLNNHRVEERRISYTAAGVDSIVINELMVRPVRRVEAEMIPAATAVTDLPFVPSPRVNLATMLPEVLSPGPDVNNVLPVFDVTTGTLPVALLGGNTSEWDTIQGDIVMGEFAYRESTLGRYVIDNTADEGEIIDTADVLQYVVFPTDGLPPGRYYLTVNINNGDLVNRDDLEYAVKYFNPTLGFDNVQGRSILEDIQANLTGDTSNTGILNNGVLAESQDTLETTYFETHWARPPVTHYSDPAGGSGEPIGWVYLDGTPTQTMDGNPADRTALAAEGYYLDGGGAFAPADLLGTPADFNDDLLTHTITVPTVDSGLALCIAFRKATDDVGSPLAINFLDFSQEPDHEYVELANNSDEEIDLSGFQLEVGFPGASESSADPRKSNWSIPQGTTIAANGLLLLGFDKFDQYMVDQTSMVNNNGMGLASGGVLGSPLFEVTMPPHGLDSNEDVAVRDIFSPLIRTNDAQLFAGVAADETGSVFRRIAGDIVDLRDYLDTDGNGVDTTPFYVAAPELFTLDPSQANPTLANSLLLDTDNIGADIETTSTLGGGFIGENKPWDRIVQLQNNSMGVGEPVLDDILDIDALARLVLRGGVFPNYPERDGIDNDGDAGFIVVAGQCVPVIAGVPTFPAIDVPGYRPGVLDKDMVDNNLDGLIDERPIALDTDGDLCPDFIDLSASEGVDEGGRIETRFPVTGEDTLRWRRYGPGSFEFASLPVVFFRDRSLMPPDFDYVQGFTNGLLREDPDNPFSVGVDAFSGGVAESNGLLRRIGNALDDVVFNNYGIPFIAQNASDEVPPDDLPALYLGTEDDPQDWKAFVERRWNPGDNVFVTLLDRNSLVVDQVTYRELDVINRAVDDVMPTPHIIDANLNNLADPGEFLSLHPDFATFWLPDNMALDFYRALERKSPTYTGDRFGTENRWQATDGAYDDWAESPSFVERQVDVDRTPYQANVARRTRMANFAPPTVGNTNNLLEHERLYRHAMYGSPLRMNLTQRVSENPVDNVRRLVASGDLPGVTLGDRLAYSFGTLPARAFDQFYELDDLNVSLFTESPRNVDWTHFRAKVRNRPFVSAGDLLHVPLMSFQHDMLNTRFFGDPANNWLHDMTRVNNVYNLALNTTPLNFLHQDFSLRSATLGYDETNAAPVADETLARFNEVPNPLDVAVKMFATESIVLTVGQADFTPIRPTPFEMDAGDYPADDLDGSRFKALMGWRKLDGQDGYIPPAAWMPVYLFPTDFDNVLDSTTFPPGKYPYYPSFPDGSNVLSNGITMLMDDNSIDVLQHLQKYLFSRDYLFGTNHQASFSANMSQAQIAERWTQEMRTAFYVTGHRNFTAGTPMNDDDRAEALFTWTAEDGLENGEYILYVGTFIPDLSKRLRQANDGFVTAPADLPDVTTEGTIVGTVPKPNDPALPDLDLLTPFADEILLRNEVPIDTSESVVAGLDPGFNNFTEFNPKLGLDVITDRTRAQGLAPQIVSPVTAADEAARDRFELTGELPPGLPHPNDWRPSTAYRPDGDGYIFYSDSAEGGWKPIIVRVTDNFLALRVRNLGAPGEVAAISQVVLAPRKRIPGKININTVSPKMIAASASSGTAASFTLFDSLLGLPGVVDAGLDPGRRLLPTDDLALLSGTLAGAALGSGQARPAPGSFTTEDIPPFRNGGVDDPGDSFAINQPDFARNQLSALMLWGRERYDGNEQFRDEQHYDGRYYRNPADLVKESSNFPHPSENPFDNPGFVDNENNNVYPLSNQNDPEVRFDEVTRRFRRMSNLLTTRSDIFEIIATVQAGYGVDQNGDGRISYRTNDEFVTTAETKTRMVYERRSPSESSDINDLSD